MRSIRYAVLLATIVASTQLPAEAAKIKQIDTTGEFVALCSVNADDPVYNAAMSFCLGYIDAVMDYHQALTAGDKYQPIACPDTEITRQQVVATLLEWSKNNAQYLESETPVHGVMRAAADKWPCPGQ